MGRKGKKPEEAGSSSSQSQSSSQSSTQQHQQQSQQHQQQSRRQYEQQSQRHHPQQMQHHGAFQPAQQQQQQGPSQQSARGQKPQLSQRQGPPQHPAWGQQPTQQQQQQGPSQQSARGQKPQLSQRQGPPQHSAWGQQPTQQQQQQGPSQQSARRQKPQLSQRQGPPQHSAWGQQPTQQQQQQGPSQQSARGQKPQLSQQQGPPQHSARPKSQAGVSGQQQQTTPPTMSPRKQTPEEQILPLTRQLENISIQPSEKVKSQSPGEAVCFDPKASIPESVAKALVKQIPKRTNVEIAGTQGQRIKVDVNMISIHFSRNFCTKATHYDVTFVPDTPKSLLPVVMEKMRQVHYKNRYPAFDGRKNLFSATDLPISDEFETEIGILNTVGKEKKFQVKFQKVNYVDLSWLKNVKPGMHDSEKDSISIQVLDIVLRAAPMSCATPVGRSFFTPPEGRIWSLGEGMDLWVGTFQSAVMGWKPFLNIDVAHKGFPKAQSVIEAMKEVVKHPRDVDTRNVTLEHIIARRQDVSKFLKGLRVSSCIPGQPNSKRTYKIVDLAQSARDSQFDADGNGQRTTVERYFITNKQYQLQYPLWPCLWVQPKEKNILIPCELCSILPGQVTNKKLMENQTSNMIKQAATDTNVRKEKIMRGFNKMKYNQNQTMNEFGISVGNQFETVDARVLTPPTLLYDRNVTVSKGVWRASKMLQPSSLQDNKWTILCLDKYLKDSDTYKLVDLFTRNDLGMNIGKPKTPFGRIQIQRDLRSLLDYFQGVKKDGIELVIVIIPDRHDAYEKVKQVTELKVGVLTSCLKAVTVQRKLNPATVGNILLKINAKLNGVNHSFIDTDRPYCLKSPCMIIGADVTHPAPDAIDKPSIAAVASSHDPKAFKYNIEIRLQPPRTEIITDLEQIMVNQLRYFFKQTGYQPKRLIFYRDGVSEGQFPQVMHHEITAIRSACKKMNINYEPPITFLVVQKRHHIRFFPKDKRNSDDRNFNVQAGTIVDTMITHPQHIDFYLVSHASIQGTARPTKYRCLWDDNNMSEDDIESLTYYLCHMFSRCTRSVSYPAPTYYAHLAAFRARALTHDVPIKMNQLAEEQRKKLTLNTDVSQRKPMFFV